MLRPLRKNLTRNSCRGRGNDGKFRPAFARKCPAAVSVIDETTSSPPSPAAASAAKTFAGPNGHWLRGCIRQMQADPLGFYSNAWRQYGDYVRVRAVRGIDCYVLTHPDAVEHVLHKRHRNYRKPNVFYKSVGLLVGNGLFTNEGDSWTNQRRLVSPAFYTQHLARLCPGIVEGAAAFVDTQRPRTGQPIDIADGMMKLGLRIASTTLFSSDISGDADVVGQAFRVAFRHIGNRMNSLQLIPNWFPTAPNRKFNHAKRQLDVVVRELIASRRTLANQPPDLLSVMLGARNERTGAGMSESLLMDEVLTLLTAGHENIGAALAWTWYLLATHAEIQESLYDEIHGWLRGRSIAFDDLAHLPLLKAVFEESLRLYPPGWGEMRETIEADDIDGYAIPRRALIILCQWVTHRHPDFWTNPRQFSPQRFLPPAVKEQHRFAYFPFGGGPRICIGTQLAMIEGALVIATILQAFRVELAAGQVIEPDATFTLRPRYGLKVLLHPR